MGRRYLYADRIKSSAVRSLDSLTVGGGWESAGDLFKMIQDTTGYCLNTYCYPVIRIVLNGPLDYEAGGKS